ncbi:hypothetical protein BKA64DRAFT_481335 [Cadophora sp. MPI-SDFR-AT-0126]|nr:hypothetical protein BKA64DRAFT_481335 [Leotiomycetes sp. MPI-SDFR-AT-0126]
MTRAPPPPDFLPTPIDTETSISDGGTPAFPPFPPRWPPFPFRSVRTGAWLLNYTPLGSSLVAYDGTLRVETITGGRRASGDLYQRPTIRIPFPAPRTILLPPPNPANGIPIQAINKYRYYLRVTKILEGITFGSDFQLGLELYLFTPTSNGAGTWSTSPIKSTATMRWTPAPAGYPSSNDYLEGDLKQDDTNTVLGRLKMGWISKYYRKATIEIDAVAGSEVPLDSGKGHNWQTVGDSIGYDLKINISERNIPEVSGESWADNEMNDTMISHREPVNLNSVWHYHILAVHLIDSTPRGIMYDAGATDSDHIPREGLGISTHWIIDPDWGTVGGVRFGLAKAPHFRTAVHELGHALGLIHNTVDLGFMNTSDVIAAAGTPALPFPDNIKWAFADNDLQSLRHWPDIFIRPGGVPFGDASSTAPFDDDRALTLENPDLKLELTPLLEEVPIGAPVRVDLKLTNNSKVTVKVPARIDLKSTSLQGVVKDSTGTERSFKSLIGCVDELPLTKLEPEKSITQSLTLWRGGDGALFPISGVSEISVTLRWALPSAGETGLLPEAAVQASTTVFITGASTASHAKAAHKLLTTPDAHLVLAFGGTHLKDGFDAVEFGTGNDVLGKHWSAVKAKALAKDGKKEPGRQLLGGAQKPVMSDNEKDKLQLLLK